MALNWNWSDKCGAIRFTQKRHDKEYNYTVSLYQGNAYLIMLWEYQENGQDMYNLYSFWADKDHAKRCLGIDPKYTATYGDNTCSEWESITLYRDKLGAKKTGELVGMLAKAFDHLDIHITNEPKEEDE